MRNRRSYFHVDLTKFRLSDRGKCVLPSQTPLRSRRARYPFASTSHGGQRLRGVGARLRAVLDFVSPPDFS